MTQAKGTPVPDSDGAVIPPGRYWLSVYGEPGDGQAASKERRSRFVYDDWKASKPEVKVETNQEDADVDPRHLFVIFRVPAGVSNFGLPGVYFPTKLLGFPEVAPATVTGAEDTVQRPLPQADVLDVLADQVSGERGANLLKGVVFAAIAVGAVALLVSVAPALLALKRRK
jgi:hypothetical protein